MVIRQRASKRPVKSNPMKNPFKERVPTKLVSKNEVKSHYVSLYQMVIPEKASKRPVRKISIQKRVLTKLVSNNEVKNYYVNLYQMVIREKAS